jgi:DNA polymerase-3 subunit epsilon
MNNSFTAIDFETPTSNNNSICAVGIVTVKNGHITDEYHTLIKPPDNKYSWHNIDVHGITAEDTKNALTFVQVYPEIKKRLIGKTVVAHNESFDRNVLKKTMKYYGLDYSELNLQQRWECTYKIYRAKGYRPTKLNVCCQRQGIELNHHEALSDARACAKLYLMQ